eukprot:UN25981
MVKNPRKKIQIIYESARYYFNHAYVIAHATLNVHIKQKTSELPGSFTLSPNSTLEVLNEKLETIAEEFAPDSWNSIFILGEPSKSFLKHFVSGKLNEKRIEKLIVINENVGIKYPFLVGLSFGDLPFYSREIMNHLYLGSRTNALDRKAMVDHLKITNIINVSGSPATLFNNPTMGQNYLRFEVADEEDQDMIEVFEKSWGFIKNCLEKKKQNVLVHCDRGVSRSGAIVVGYIMREKKNKL